ncbi:MAG: hypothetical protein ACI837_001324 [Crocinitomicaceae bacterium]|jgi:hypothetical protein
MRIAAILVVSLVLITGCNSTSTGKSSSSKTENILFIGNSYTYRNNGVDKHLAALLNADSESGDEFVTKAAEGKYHLYTHWDDPETKEIFESRKWDKVILQEYSSGPIRETKEFFDYGNRWDKLIKSVNKQSKVFLYSTWKYKGAHGMDDSISSQYNKLSEQIHASVVPVGMLWKSIEGKVNLYHQDGAHPNRKGTFLTACLFYERLFGKDVTKTKNTDAILSSADQTQLKKWAHEFKENPDS